VRKRERGLNFRSLRGLGSQIYIRLKDGGSGEGRRKEKRVIRINRKTGGADHEAHAHRKEILNGNVGGDAPRL